MKPSSLLILLGIIFLTCSAYLIYQRVDPFRLSFSSYTQKYPETTSGNFATPAKIIIKDLNIELPIQKAKSGKKWQAFSDAVSYLVSSPIPGEMGNSILYGHNWHNMLGKIRGAKIGQDIVINFSDGSRKVFKVKYIQEVSPEQISILNPSLDTRVTLYTCSGFLDSKRFVVVATLI